MWYGTLSKNSKVELSSHGDAWNSTEGCITTKHILYLFIETQKLFNCIRNSFMKLTYSVVILNYFWLFGFFILITQRLFIYSMWLLLKKSKFLFSKVKLVTFRGNIVYFYLVAYDRYFPQHIIKYFATYQMFIFTAKLNTNLYQNCFCIILII